MSLNSLHTAMLAAIPDVYDKTEGYPTYDFTRAFATGLSNIEQNIQLVIQQLNVDNMKGSVLDSFVYQRKGLTRKQGASATAVLKATVPLNKKASIKKGYSFQTADGVKFVANENKAVNNNDTFTVVAVEDGVSGNVSANTITIISSTINNLSAVTNPAQSYGGVDAESDAEFRQRYYDAIYDASNGTNKGSYEVWAKTVVGVAEARCIPCVDETYTAATNECALQLVMRGVNGHMIPANQTLIDSVQSFIDPNQNGDGSGAAPIGAKCNVVAPLTQSVAINCTYAGQLGANDVSTIIANSIDEMTLISDVIYYSKLMKDVAKHEGVDWCTITIGGSAANYTLTDHKIAAPTITVTQQT